MYRGLGENGRLTGNGSELDEANMAEGISNEHNFPSWFFAHATLLRSVIMADYRNCQRQEETESLLYTGLVKLTTVLFKGWGWQIVGYSVCA